MPSAFMRLLLGCGLDSEQKSLLSMFADSRRVSWQVAQHSRLGLTALALSAKTSTTAAMVICRWSVPPNAFCICAQSCGHVRLSMPSRSAIVCDTQRHICSVKATMPTSVPLSLQSFQAKATAIWMSRELPGFEPETCSGTPDGCKALIGGRG